MLIMTPKSIKEPPQIELNEIEVKKKAKKLRWHLESLRLLVDMVKKREIKKYKIIKLEVENFSKQLKFFENSSLLPKKLMKEDDSKIMNVKGSHETKVEKEKWKRFTSIERLD